MAGTLKILWSGLALSDLTEIREYISHDNPAPAKKLAQKIGRQVLRLRRFPLSGRLVPEFETKGYREIIVAPYRIVYQVTSRNVVILRVWHGRRDLPKAVLIDHSSKR